MRVLALTAVVAALLGGCSPYRLSPQVQSFSDSIAEANTAMAEGVANLRADLVAQRTTLAVAARGPVNIPPQCGTSATRVAGGALFPPCVATAISDKEPIDVSIFEEALTKRRQMSALAEYAAGLAGVADARDSQALSNATDKLSGAALLLATATGQPQATAVPVVVGAVGLAARIALDAERMAILMRTVKDERLNAAIKTVATALGTYLTSVQQERLRIRNEDDRFRGDEVAASKVADRLARISAIQDRLAVADALRAADPKATAAAIVEAQDKLRVAVEDPNANIAALASAVGELADQVKKLRAGMAAKTTQGA